MQDSSVNHLSLVPPFISSDAHLLWKLMTKGERLYKDMKYARGIREKLDLDMDTDKEGATLRN